MMNTTTQAKLDKMKRELSHLRRTADASTDFETADAIQRSADFLGELIEMVEFDLLPACEDESQIAA